MRERYYLIALKISDKPGWRLSPLQPFYFSDSRLGYLVAQQTAEEREAAPSVAVQTSFGRCRGSPKNSHQDSKRDRNLRVAAKCRWQQDQTALSRHSKPGEGSLPYPDKINNCSRLHSSCCQGQGCSDPTHPALQWRQACLSWMDRASTFSRLDSPHLPYGEAGEEEASQGKDSEGGFHWIRSSEIKSIVGGGHGEDMTAG